MTDGGSRRRGRGHGQRLLYWFRTPPGVRVGRAPIDEHAMRLLEEHNPDIQFDWARLLKEVPQEQGARRDRDRDPRDRDRRRDGRDQRPPERSRPSQTTAAAVPPAPPAIVHDASAELAEERAAAHADLILEEFGATAEPGEPVEPVEPVEPGEPGEPEPGEPVEPVEPEEPESVAVRHGEPLAADHAEYVEYAEASHARVPTDAQPGPQTAPSAAAARLGADAVTRLRARYAQLVARIAEREMDDAARAELNARVERLNPDAWLTADEVAAALEQYESVFDSLRAEVGHQRRR
ncbi:MAG TPA: hypothetical protein VFK57_11000 [Vicinamibacterales bacterium]|nr:hypothetical protein [Vicinamibacterales bacterium]